MSKRIFFLLLWLFFSHKSIREGEKPFSSHLGSVPGALQVRQQTDLQEKRFIITYVYGRLYRKVKTPKKQTGLRPYIPRKKKKKTDKLWRQDQMGENGVGAMSGKFCESE